MLPLKSSRVVAARNSESLSERLSKDARSGMMVLPQKITKKPKRKQKKPGKEKKTKKNASETSGFVTRGN